MTNMGVPISRLEDNHIVHLLLYLRIIVVSKHKIGDESISFFLLSVLNFFVLWISNIKEDDQEKKNKSS